MKKTLLRVYDCQDEYAMSGNCYFVILPDDYDDMTIERLLWQITSMRWQRYTSYVIAEADIAPEEEYWSEITGYELKECKINISRVTILKRYRLPEDIMLIRYPYYLEHPEELEKIYN